MAILTESNRVIAFVVIPVIAVMFLLLNIPGCGKWQAVIQRRLADQRVAFIQHLIKELRDAFARRYERFDNDFEFSPRVEESTAIL